MVPGRDHFRRQPRARLRLRARIVLPREQAAAPPAAVDCTTRDLGLGGAFLLTSLGIDPGDRLTVELSSPFSWEPLRLKAVVRRRSEGTAGEPPGLGVAFVDLGQRDVVALH